MRMAIYLDHFGLDAPPFKITPNTGFFFPGANRGATLEALQYAITHGEGLIKVVGEVGSGKTMLSRVLLEQLPGHITSVYIANPSLSREDILLTLAEELGVAVNGEKPANIVRMLQARLIEKYAAGGQVVVLIDEAHAMPDETLEEIRLLSNLESSQHKLLQIVLFAQPELDAKLARQEMRQLRERITYSFNLPPLATDDVRGYLEFRLRAAGYRGPFPFAAAAIRHLAQQSEGLVRRINIIADKALLAAFASGRHEVTLAEARQATRDCEFGTPPPSRARRLLRGLLLAAGMTAALGLTALAGWHARGAQPVDRPAPPAAAAAVPPPHTPAAEPAAAPPPEPAPATVPASAPAAVLPAPDPVAAPAVPPEPTPPAMPEVAAPAPAAAQATGKAGVPPRHAGFTVQLAYAGPEARSGLDALRQRATQHAGETEVFLQPTWIGGREVLALCVGRYPTREAAHAARQDLPDALARHKPQIRSFADLTRSAAPASPSDRTDTAAKP